MSFAGMNYLAIVVAAVAAWLVGGIWYSVLSKHWVAAQGMTMDEMKAKHAALKGTAAAWMPFVLVFIAELMALIYARNFSAAELRDLAAFYRTPIGQKLLQKMPTIAQESMTAGQQFAQAIGSDLQQRIVDELRKRGHDIKI